MTLSSELTRPNKTWRWWRWRCHINSLVSSLEGNEMVKSLLPAASEALLSFNCASCTGSRKCPIMLAIKCTKTSCANISHEDMRDWAILPVTQSWIGKSEMSNWSVAQKNLGTHWMLKPSAKSHGPFCGHGIGCHREIGCWWQSKIDLQWTMKNGLLQKNQELLRFVGKFDVFGGQVKHQNPFCCKRAQGLQRLGFSCDCKLAQLQKAAASRKWWQVRAKRQRFITDDLCQKAFDLHAGYPPRGEATVWQVLIQHQKKWLEISI